MKKQDEEKPNSKGNRKIEIIYVIIKIKEMQTNQLEKNQEISHLSFDNTNNPQKPLLG